MPTRRNYLKVRNKASLQYGCVSVFFPFLTDDAFIKHVTLLMTAAIRGGLSQAITARFIASSGDNPSRFPFFSGLILPPSFGPRMGPVNNTTLAGFHLWAIHGDRLQSRRILRLAFFFLSFLFDFFHLLSAAMMSVVSPPRFGTSSDADIKVFSAGNPGKLLRLLSFTALGRSTCIHSLACLV